MNTEDLRNERSALEAEANQLLERSDQTLAPPDAARFDQITARLAELNDAIERRQTLAQNLTRSGVTVEHGDGAAGAGEARDAVYGTVNVVRRRDAAEVYQRSDLRVDDPADGTRWRDRAMRAIDGWERSIPPDWRESAERLVADPVHSSRDRQAAEHILRTSHPDYVDAALHLLANPGHRALLPEHQRAALAEGSNPTGGFLLPTHLDPTILLTNVGVANPIRGIASVASITTNTWHGITSAGVSAEWTAEASEVTDASPSFASPTIPVHRADAYVQGSFEVFADTNIGEQLALLFADARDRLEETAHILGSGSTQPWGIVTELALVTASRVDAQTNGAFGSIDVFALDNALGDRWRRGARWIAHKAWFNRVRQLSSGSAPQHAFWEDLGGGQPALLLGYPTHPVTAMQSTLSTATASNDDVLCLADYRAGYQIVDRIGMGVAHTDWIMGANRRPTLEQGWLAYWRTGARVTVPQAFKILRV